MLSGRSTHIHLCLGCGILLVASTALDARDIHVNNTTGSDRREGTVAGVARSDQGPVKTIGRALRLADKGDRIIIANTGLPYRESITLQAGRHSGFPRQPFEIVGNGAVIQGLSPVPPSAWQHVRDDLYRFKPSRTAYHLLYLDQRPAVRKPSSDRYTVPELAAREYSLTDRHIYFRTDPDDLPDAYQFLHTDLAIGITLYEVRNVVIRDLIIQGFQLDGVNAHDSAFEVQLIGITSRGNGRSGISVGGASRVKIQASLVGNNGAAQVRTEGASTTEIIDCDLIEDGNIPKIDKQGGRVQVRDNRAAREPELTRLK